MGRHFSSNSMLLLTALSSVLLLASAEPTCDDCYAVVKSAAAYLTSEESVSKQVDILVAGVCPQVDDADTCVARLPEFWGQIASVLWPGYYDPTADWMCQGCKTAVRDVTCDECVGGLAGDGFCGQGEDPAACSEAIKVLIPLALPMLVASWDETVAAAVCNDAIPGTC